MMPMVDVASETNVITRLVQWAEQQPLIRVLLLTSSRATPTAPLDALSDYDVIVVVADLVRFAQDETWLHTFGRPLVLFRDQDDKDGLVAPIRLVLYEDSTKIDYSVWPVETLRRILAEPTVPEALDLGYRVLVDKDNLTPGLKPPTYTAHIPQRPTEQEFRALIEEFWWETTYVAKNLWREELLPAKYSLDSVMKLELLRKLLEWQIELEHNWSVKPGACGRGLQTLLPAETWSALASTYVGADLEENWQALFRTTDLFRSVAVAVGNALGYDYLTDLDQQVVRYLQKIKNLAR